jgi:glycosyltransferase involved in cell wall biosynthesis
VPGIGVRITGFLGHLLGLGAAARGYATALTAAGVPVSTVTGALNRPLSGIELVGEYGRHRFEDLAAEDPAAFELLCVNPGELPEFLEQFGADYLRGRRIGVWAWETDRIPRSWVQGMALVDEIWVYSEFVAGNLRAATDVPVSVLPPPVRAPARFASQRLGVPDGFLFLFVFDYSSTIQRKNPEGVIEAFARAFAPGEGPQLLIKTINAPLLPLDEEAVLWAARGRPDVHVIDRSLPAEEVDALMGACDCYVSLHRSEGLGLTMAEAMTLGKPVIATGYSGNVDFMNAENSFLVGHGMALVGPDCLVYPADGEWAEPDLDQAAALMRRVYEDPTGAAEVGARAREQVGAQLSPQATGAGMRRRLQELAGSP